MWKFDKSIITLNRLDEVDYFLKRNIGLIDCSNPLDIDNIGLLKYYLVNTPANNPKLNSYNFKNLDIECFNILFNKDYCYHINPNTMLYINNPEEIFEVFIRDSGMTLMDKKRCLRLCELNKRSSLFNYNRWEAFISSVWPNNFIREDYIYGYLCPLNYISCDPSEDVIINTNNSNFSVLINEGKREVIDFNRFTYLNYYLTIFSNYPKNNLNFLQNIKSLVLFVRTHVLDIISYPEIYFTSSPTTIRTSKLEVLGKVPNKHKSCIKLWE